MQNKTHYATWYGPHHFYLNHAHCVSQRWWGGTADENTSFWAEPCFGIEFSFERPWFRITTGYRLCTMELFDVHLATVPNSWAASKLLATILADIQSFPIRVEPSGRDPGACQDVPAGELPF